MCVNFLCFVKPCFLFTSVTSGFYKFTVCPFPHACARSAFHCFAVLPFYRGPLQRKLRNQKTHREAAQPIASSCLGTADTILWDGIKFDTLHHCCFQQARTRQWGEERRHGKAEHTHTYTHTRISQDKTLYKAEEKGWTAANSELFGEPNQQSIAHLAETRLAKDWRVASALAVQSTCE